jgi:FkbM family methyltransferase
LGLKHTVRRVLRKAGLDLNIYSLSGDARGRRAVLMSAHGIDGVLDVGANRGEYGLMVRADGFRGEIHSFEPLSTAYGPLQRLAAADGNWKAYNVALGAKEEDVQLNIAGNSYSSSILDMMPKHDALAPEAGYTGSETVSVRRLDGFAAALGSCEQRYYLKADTQGYELAVLEGAGDLLNACPLVELELSFVELYDGQPLFDEVHAWMQARGYRPVSFDVGPGQVDEKTGEALQTDVVYLRNIVGG